MVHTEKNGNRLTEKCYSTSSFNVMELCLVIGEILLIFFKTLLEIAKSVFRKLIPRAEKSVKNEIVLITGAGRGIGKELALQYASLGATVVCWGITKEKNLETVDQIAQLGYPKAYFYQCDVSDQKCVMQTAEKVLQEVGDITILVNNAGVAVNKSILEQTPTEIEKLLNVNFVSHFWTIQAFLPTMLKNNHGHIVANSSAGGLIAEKNGTSYCSSKFAIKGMMESLSRELQSDPNCQIKLTTVYAFFVETDIYHRVAIRFPKIMPVLKVTDVAKIIISAQRRDILEIAIPAYFYYLDAYFRLVPNSVRMMVQNFFDVSVSDS